MYERLDKFLLWAMAVAIFAGLTSMLVWADRGYEGAVRKEQGTYSATYMYTGSSTAGTAFFSNDIKRPDGFCRSNGWGAGDYGGGQPGSGGRRRGLSGVEH